jgi:hypothetical protein
MTRQDSLTSGATDLQNASSSMERVSMYMFGSTCVCTVDDPSLVEISRHM